MGGEDNALIEQELQKNRNRRLCRGIQQPELEGAKRRLARMPQDVAVSFLDHTPSPFHEFFGSVYHKVSCLSMIFHGSSVKKTHRKIFSKKFEKTIDKATGMVYN